MWFGLSWVVLLFLFFLIQSSITYKIILWYRWTICIPTTPIPSIHVELPQCIELIELGNISNMFLLIFVLLLNLICLSHFNYECRQWQEQVLQFFNRKSEDRSWSLILELKVCCVYACIWQILWICIKDQRVYMANIMWSSAGAWKFCCFQLHRTWFGLI